MPTPAHITIEQRRARLGARHHLARPAPTVEAVAKGVVALHSTAAASVYLSAWARTKAFEQAQLSDAIYERRTLVRMLGMRRTVFVVPVATAPIVDAACTQALLPGETKKLLTLLEGAGVTTQPARWLRTVEDKTVAALEAAGEATAAELAKAVPELAIKLSMATGKAYEATVGVGTRVLFLLAASGRVVRGRPIGTWVSSQYRWAPASTWVDGDLSGLDPAEARAELARLWLWSFGPGSLTDLKWWAAWTVAQTKAALAAVGAVEVTMELDDDGRTGPGYLLPDDTAKVRVPPAWVALLPTLDPTIMGWKDRDWYLGPHRTALFDTYGNGGPSVWANGRIIGGWGQLADGTVVVERLDEVAAPVVKKIDAERDRLHGWLGGQRAPSSFRTPLEKAIASR